ncbi:MAG: TetR/AcrR family transcriptional regulator [Pseudomonadota bacterium]
MDQLDRDPTRRRILEAALTCFNATGMAGTTIRHIQEASSISVGSIYHHFGDKEGIAFALYQLGIEDMHQALLRRLGGRADLSLTIRGCVDDYLDWYRDHAELGRHLFQFSDTRFVAGRESAIAALGREFLDRFGELAEDEGWGGRLDAEFAVRFVTGGCREFLRSWLVTQDSVELEAARPRLQDLALATFGLH